MGIIRIFFIGLCCVFVAGLPSPTENTQRENLKALLKKEKESEALEPVELTKEITFIHEYNDTDTEEPRKHVSSKITSLGGLENKIQNLGGVQKTVLNNKIQYNFYFWLVPKNFRRFAQEQEKH